MMKNFKVLVITLLCVVGLITPMTTNAYVFGEPYETEDDIIFAKKDDPNCDTNVSCFLLIDTINYKSTNHTWGSFDFRLYEGPALEHYKEVLTIGAKVEPYNKVVYDTLDGYEIWLIDFDLEDGLYRFPGTSSNRRDLPTIEVLTSTCEREERITGSTVEEYEYNAMIANHEYMVLDDTDLRLYAFCGTKFSDDTLNAFMQWSKEKEAYFLEQEELRGGYRGIRDAIYGNEVLWFWPTIGGRTLSEYDLQFVENGDPYSRKGFPEGIKTYEEYITWAYAQKEGATPPTSEEVIPPAEDPESIPESEQDTTNTTTPEVETTPSVDTSVTVEETVTQMPEVEEPESKETNPIGLVIGGVGFVVLAGVVAVLVMKKKK